MAPTNACYLVVYFLFFLILSIYTTQTQAQIMGESGASVHKCVHATRKLSKTGDGTTDGSCLGCDPAVPDCFPGCQALIDKVYLRCDGICLPDGYYYDPQWEQEGCWEDVKPKLKIKIERCGCNAAFSLSPSTAMVVSSVLALTWYLIQ